MKITVYSNRIRELSGEPFDLLTALEDTEAMLTTERAESSYGQPVLVYRGRAYGPGDLPGLDPLLIRAGSVTPASPGAALVALRLPSERTCAVCGRRYIGSGRSRYCGRACQQRAYRARQRQ